MSVVNFFVFTVLMGCGFLFSQHQTCEDSTLNSNVVKHIRARVELVGPYTRIICHKNEFCRSSNLLEFYINRQYRPAWIDDTGLLPPGEALFFALQQAQEDGLLPQDYHLSSIESLMEQIFIAYLQNKRPVSKIAELDLLLTDAFFLYTSHLANGRVKVRQYATDFSNDIENFPDLLEKGLNNNILETIEGVKPTRREYKNLALALNRYQEIVKQGGWPVTPSGPVLKMGSKGERVKLLHKRLAMSGDLKEVDEKGSDVFGPALDQAVRHFQKRRGLVDDGVVGPASLAALNVSAAEHLRKIELNMERWRWLPKELGDRYIRVDIPLFKLSLIEKEQSVLSMRVVVGKPERPTPLIAKPMTYLVINPYWYIPPKIAVEDKLPLIRRDPGYFSRNNIRVYRESVQLDPRRINWKAVSKGNFSFNLRQTPGTHNALGRIKFMFPNKHSVYLHDTPSRHLFSKAVRTFSSGCIRIEKPVDLAEYLLHDKPGWTKDKIRSVISTDKSRTIKLTNPVPVYLMYWTAWSDDEGFVSVGSDTYDLDTIMDKEMPKRPY
jgi:murein L,D-transpeptidase YcbB/YkuD